MATCLFVTAAGSRGALGSYAWLVGAQAPGTTGVTAGGNTKGDRRSPRGTHEPKWSISQRRARTMT